MADDDNSGEKEFAPTSRKLDQARQKGDVPRSQELGAALALIAATIMIFNAGTMVAEPLIEALREAWSLHALRDLQNGHTAAPIIIRATAKTVLPVLGALAAAGVFFQLWQSGWTLPSGDEAGLKIDFTRLDAVKNAKEKFGLKAILDGIKNILKLVLVAAVLVYSANETFEASTGYLGLSPMGLVKALSQSIGTAVFRIAIVAVIITIIDYAFESFRFTRKMRMSKQDIKDEMKQSEGDPQVKAQRKKRQREMSNRQAVQSVGDATVLVANPTHFSVTLRYRRGEDAAPMVLGKGQDRIALKMRERAREHGVPIVENKPLARALYAIAKEGQPIPADFYKQVAEVLALVLGNNQPAGAVR